MWTGHIIEECTGGLIASMSRDGTDIRVLVEEVLVEAVEGYDNRELRLAQPAATAEPVTGSPTSSGEGRP